MFDGGYCVTLCSVDLLLLEELPQKTNTERYYRRPTIIHRRGAHLVSIIKKIQQPLRDKGV